MQICRKQKEYKMKDDKSIHQLIKEQENEGKRFLVPSYQRGYRWQRVNVIDLLNDLCEFIHNDKDSYSLQPLVVYIPKDKENSYHVVDGQQRITTISILLGYLELKQISITYESRKGQQENHFVENCRNIDQYHVNMAYSAIKNWFEKNPKEKDNFIKLLTDQLEKRVKFIWYCTDDDEVATFIRLNKDKISLTNAELIKAMLLKKGNFNGDSVLMQKNIAVEWNKIENTFNDDAFWGFIRPMDDNRATRIDFLFEIIKQKNMLSFKPTEDTGSDQYSTFRYFYQYFKEKKELAFQQIWDKVNQLFNILIHWYNEIEIYHYIGFLIIDNEYCVSGLLDEWLKPEMTIVDFKKILKVKINDIIKQGDRKCNNLAKQYKYNEESGTDKTHCRPLLLLFNIQRIIILNRNLNKNSDTQLFNKFPFYLYKLENWNVEHIASNTDNDLTKINAQKEWLKTFLFDQATSESNMAEIKNFIRCEKPEKAEFDNLRKKLIDEQDKTIKKEEQLDDREKNQIWNFCLLDEHTNKSYGNSIFPVKRRIIMGKDMGKKYVLDNDLNETTIPNKVAFVPGCTKDAFIKAFTASDTSNREWSRTDAIAYRQEMYNCLKDDFNVSLQ